MGRALSIIQSTGYDTSEVDWRATLARDRSADGRFVYAVRSTGIYCRPSCPSRKPDRGNVVFFRGPEAAEEAGFRPCRRCGPREDVARDVQVEIVRRACRYLLEPGEERRSLAELGRHVGMSPHRLRRAFKQIVGITPRAYADAVRLDRLKGRLKKGDSVTHALYDAGYGSSSRLYERAQDRLGMTPGTYRRGGRGLRIEYAITDCPLGRLLVGATPRGVCAVYLGDADPALEAALFDEYPAAEIHRGDGVARWTGEIVRHLEGNQVHLDLPTDVTATAFQQQVWQQLRRIPYGQTRTYGEIAKRIGAPRAARAVGRACATNPVCLVIPCHRAVAEGGGLGGYRWGVARKERLLTNERRTTARRGSSTPAAAASRGS